MDSRCLHISEWFYSIQGESSWSGYPCAFIRLAGCNLRCRYCDSAYTWEQGREATYESILEWLAHYPGVLVEITGGEPLLQEALYPFLDLLLADGRTVLIETNGSLSIAKIPAQVVVILDIKCPDSSMGDRTDWNNVDLLKARRNGSSRDEIKFVISSEKDFFWAKNVIEKYRLADIATLLFSPVEYLIAPTSLAELIMAHRMPAKLQLQLHRLLWPEVDRGV
ncbi:MAG: radical SAM protein [Desulfobulbaceae bacterium]|nr:radical SAM protein [Desulfobulbaceae bacterium]